jgi:hypothetical protein
MPAACWVANAGHRGFPYSEVTCHLATCGHGSKSGLRLFPDLGTPIRLKLAGATTFKTGVIAKVFQPA